MAASGAADVEVAWEGARVIWRAVEVAGEAQAGSWVVEEGGCRSSTGRAWAPSRPARATMSAERRVEGVALGGEVELLPVGVARKRLLEAWASAEVEATEKDVGQEEAPRCEAQVGGRAKTVDRRVALVRGRIQ